MDGGIRPVGISEVLRRVIAKTIAWKIGDDITQVIGSRQCAGLQGACEASVKAMGELYQEGKAILILDAEGAYNNLNRYGALRIAARDIPDAYQALRKIYEHPIRALYNGKEFQIEEGTIQGCPLSTAVYDLGIQPLANEMETKGIRQIWVVDDLAAVGTPEELKKWYNKLSKMGQDTDIE